MSEAPSRDPIALVLQFLILAVLAWIAIGISNLASTAPELAPSHEAQLQRTLAALDRTLEAHARSPGRQDRLTAASMPGSVEAAGDEPDAGDAVPVLALVRRKLARPWPAALHPDSGGPLFDHSERVSAKAALAALHELHNRLRTRGEDIRIRTRRDYLLMDRAAVVQRFGRPYSIEESQSGASELWYYRLGDDHSVTITIRGDYVINIY